LDNAGMTDCIEVNLFHCSARFSFMPILWIDFDG